jgi:hypothetical protein
MEVLPGTSGCERVCRKWTRRAGCHEGHKARQTGFAVPVYLPLSFGLLAGADPVPPPLFKCLDAFL